MPMRQERGFGFALGRGTAESGARMWGSSHEGVNGDAAPVAISA